MRYKPTLPTIPTEGLIGDIMRAIRRADHHTVAYCETACKLDLEIAHLAAKQLVRDLEVELAETTPRWPTKREAMHAC